MPSLKDIRRRIDTVRNTQQITKAMKMVAAAKLRRAQEGVESARPYAEKLSELLESVGSRVGPDAHPFLSEGTDAPATVILVASDRGLCGAYNGGLIRATEEFMESDAGRDASLICCGRRAHDYFKKRIDDRIVAAHVNRPGGNDLALAREVVADVSERFLSGKTGSVYLVYSEFRSAISQQPKLRRLLPIGGEADAEDGADDAAIAGDSLYEPDPVSLMRSLVSRFVETNVYQAMLEGTASEHGARMTAMDNATRNASEMIDRLTLVMNRARQAGITTELMEIVGGAEALKG